MTNGDVLERYRIALETPTSLGVGFSDLLRDMAAEIERLRSPPLRAREEIARALAKPITGFPFDDLFPPQQRNLLEAADHLADALSRTAGQEWREISSAPKDGTKIILYNEKWETFPLASWEWGEGPDEDGTGGWCAWHVVDDRFPGAEDGIIYPSENYMPTHWLPAPPVAEPLLAEKSEVK